MNKIVVLGDSDNVATCLLALSPQDKITLTVGGKTQDVEVLDAIEFGHKIAIKPMATGDDVLKYGEVIGRASQPIKVGAWVHIHNIESVRARGDIE